MELVGRLLADWMEGFLETVDRINFVVSFRIDQKSSA